MQVRLPGTFSTDQIIKALYEATRTISEIGDRWKAFQSLSKFEYQSEPVHRVPISIMLSVWPRKPKRMLWPFWKTTLNDSPPVLKVELNLSEDHSCINMHVFNSSEDLWEVDPESSDYICLQNDVEAFLGHFYAALRQTV